MATTLPGSPYVESSDLVANYPAVSEALAERVDLVGVLPFADAAARTTALPTPTDGQYSYLQDINSTEYYNGAAWLPAGGKILQVVRVTDVTSRSTTSTTYVDVTGLTVTITPRQSTSNVLLLVLVRANVVRSTTQSGYGIFQIADNSNNAISGAEEIVVGGQITGGVNDIKPLVTLGYATPGSTAAVTYKCRFKTDQAVVTFALQNNLNTAQMYAIEVSA